MPKPDALYSRATWGNNRDLLGGGAPDGTETYGLETIFDGKRLLALTHYRRETEFEFPPSDDMMMNIALVGDCFFELKTKGYGTKKDKTMCSFWLNTAFLEGEATVLTKPEIDKCHQDMKVRQRLRLH